MSSGTYTEHFNYVTSFNVPLLIHIVVCSSGLNNEIMMINGKFTNGGQIPAHGNEKTNEQLVSELSQKNRNLRRALNKLIELCDNTKQQNAGEVWMQRIGFAKQMLDEN
jgi:hypothetical protein